MQAPDFDHKNQRWDQFKAHYVALDPSGYNDYGAHLYQFDTGEVICTGSDVHPDKRRRYDFGVRVVATIDDECPRLMTPDGVVLAKGWLSGKATDGLQTLLIDEDSGHAVRMMSAGLNGVPCRFHKEARVWFAGNGAPPVGSPVTVMRPRIYTPEERDRANRIISACKAWYGMTTEKERDIDYRDLVGKPVVRDDLFLATDFAGIRNSRRVDIAATGTEAEIIATEHPYLLVAGQQKEKTK